MSALLNKCITCNDASGLLILLLSEIIDWCSMLLLILFFSLHSHLKCSGVHFSSHSHEAISNVALSCCVLCAGVHIIYVPLTIMCVFFCSVYIDLSILDRRISNYI